MVIDEDELYEAYWIERGNCYNAYRGWPKFGKITRKSDKKTLMQRRVFIKNQSEEVIKGLITEAMVLQLCNHENIISSPHICKTIKRM